MPILPRPVPILSAVAVAGTLLLAGPAPGRAAPAVCDQAAARAAERTGVPLDLLLAVTRAETGRGADGGRQPWPWTINEGGPGTWFDTRAEAVAHVQAAIARGASNIDIGCFQLNYRWHGAAFASVEAMFDPAANALYAAQFLSRLQAETGSWRAAAGAFHSRTPDLAERYLARLDGLMGAPPQAPAPELVRVNGFPLLVAGRSGAIGSVVPAVLAGRPLIGP